MLPLTEPSESLHLGKEAKSLLKRLCREAGPSGAIRKADIDALEGFVEAYLGCFQTHEDSWPGFGKVEYFHLSAAAFEDLVSFGPSYTDLEEFDDYSLLEQAKDSIRNYLEDPHRSGDIVHLTEIIEEGMASAWLIVNNIDQGQAGYEHIVVGLVKTPVEAEEWLRAKGWFFLETPPSGAPPDDIELLAKRLLSALGLEKHT